MEFDGAKTIVNKEVKAVFDEHERRYGSRRIVVELEAKGILAGRYQVRSSLRKQGLKAIQPRSFVPKTTQTNLNLLRSPNLLLEMDTVNGINQVWVGDITYLPMVGGSWTYLAIWMDLFSRTIVGWKVSSSLHASLVIDSLKKAILRRRPKAGLIIHSDGGGQYMDKDFRRLLAKHQFVQSMTRVDNHYDNAFAESLFSRIKAELLRGNPFKNIEETHAKIFEYIEAYYNRKRRHSSIGYMSPEAFEAQWKQNQNCQSTQTNDPE